MFHVQGLAYSVVFLGLDLSYDEDEEIGKGVV